MENYRPQPLACMEEGEEKLDDLSARGELVSPHQSSVGIVLSVDRAPSAEIQDFTVDSCVSRCRESYNHARDWIIEIVGNEAIMNKVNIGLYCLAAALTFFVVLFLALQPFGTNSIPVTGTSKSGDTTKSLSLPTTIPSGVVFDTSLDTVMSHRGCWKVCYLDLVSNGSPPSNSLSSACTGDWVFLGTVKTATNEVLIGAFGEKEIVLTNAVMVTTTNGYGQQQTDYSIAGVLNNGVYWYNNAWYSSRLWIGFALESKFDLGAQLISYSYFDNGLGPGCHSRMGFAVTCYSGSVCTTSSCQVIIKSTDTGLGLLYQKVILTNTCPV